MTEAQSSPQAYQMLCPECAEQINGLADGLCPECGFPIKELVLHIEQTAATHRKDDRRRERSGQVEGIIEDMDSAFGGQLVVITNTKQLAVAFIPGDKSLAVGMHGALRFIGSPVARFFERETDSQTDVDVKKKSILRVFVSDIKMPARKNDCPVSIELLGALAYLNLIIAPVLGFSACGEGNTIIGAALTAQAILGTLLLRVMYQVAESIWEIRQAAVGLRDTKIHSVEEPLSGAGAASKRVAVK